MSDPIYGARFLHCCAENDRNGNPQRVYVLTDSESGDYIAAWDEGYSGHHAVPGWWREDAYNAERIKVSVREYKRILRQIPSPETAYGVPGYSHLRSEIA